MKNKNDKIKIMLIIILVYFILSWLMEGGIYGSSGEFASVGIMRMGLFDLISVIYSAFYYRVADIAFILTIGGCYEILSHTLMYRKCVDKVSEFVKGKDEIAFVVITVLMSLYASISSNVMVLLAIAPFIVSIFLRRNYNRLTAFCAGFGGIFLGYLGLTYGTYNVSYINENMLVSVNDWILYKWAFLVLAVVLFNVLSVIYMKKHSNVSKEQTKYDMFATEPVTTGDKVVVKGKKKEVKVWPLVLVSVISLATLLLGYINWKESFGLEIFNNIFNSMNKMTIADVSVFGTLFGSRLTAFGTWADLLYGLFVIVVGTIIIALISKVKFNEFLNYFAEGMKKMSGVAFMYGFVSVTLFLISMFPWPITIINKLLGSGSFNIIIIFIIAILATTMIGDGNLCAYLYSAGLTLLFGSNLVELSVIWRIGSAVAVMIAPTSILLLTTLSYLNIPYKSWIKYIWKFLALFSLATLILLAVIIYV